MNNDIEVHTIKPDESLADFVESFWMIKNISGHNKEVIVLPDGRFDIIFSYSSGGDFHIMQMGLGTEPDKNTIPAGAVMFAVSFKLLAIEYLLDNKAGTLLNNAQRLPDNFWGVTKDDLGDFENVCRKISAKMRTLIKPDIDSRKQQLFELIYASNGSLPVKELSASVYWSSRQINRYFNEQFGLSLKTYNSILRFRASLQHIKKGKLYPQLNFADQAHFIKEIKKFAGVVPKELSKNQNDRFILLSAMPDQ
jgi:AraC-like DNA-binding protein